MKTLLTATAVSALMVTSAFAACPNGQFEYHTLGTAGTPPAPAAIQQCVETQSILGLDTGEFKPVPVMDPADPTKQLVINGQPIFSASPNLTYTIPQIYGQNGVAEGNGAQVGRYEPKSCKTGTLSGNACYAADQFSAPGVLKPNATPIAGAFVPAHAVNVNNGTAIGANTSVQHDNSTAIGAGAKSTAANQVTLGTKNETISAPGITSAKSKARQVGPLEVVTTDANGNLASDGGQIFGTLDNHSAALASHQSQLASLRGRTDEAFEGVAMALAMESPQVDPGKRFGISLNYGNFEGENALAAAGKFRFDDTWAGTAGIGYGMGQNTVGFRAGVQAQW